MNPFEDIGRDRESRLPKTRIPEILRGWTEGEGFSGRTLTKCVSPFREVGDSAYCREPARDLDYRNSDYHCRPNASADHVFFNRDRNFRGWNFC